MKKVFWDSVWSGFMFFLITVLFWGFGKLESPSYSWKMAELLKVEYPKYTAADGDYNPKDSKFDETGYSKKELIALDALYNNSYNFKLSKEALEIQIEHVDPWGDSDGNEEVVALRGAIEKLGELKDKYHLKVSFMSRVIYPIIYTAIIFVINAIIYLLWGKRHRKYNREEEDRDCRHEKEIYPSREFIDKPKV